MKIKANNTPFESCPEFTGTAICVDVTPLRKQQSQYGQRDVFKIVFEVDMDREDGSRFCVWSQNFTPTLNEKSGLRKFLRGWFGRDLAKAELEDFDTEILIGKPAQLVVVHQHRDNEVYANIAACTPDKSGEPLKLSGKFIRAKDRATSPQPSPQRGEGAGAGGGYRRAQQPAEAGIRLRGRMRAYGRRACVWLCRSITDRVGVDSNVCAAGSGDRTTSDANRGVRCAFTASVRRGFGISCGFRVEG